MKTTTFVVCKSCTYLLHKLSSLSSSASCYSWGLTINQYCSRWHNLTDTELSLLCEAKSWRQRMMSSDKGSTSGLQLAVKTVYTKVASTARGVRPYDGCKCLRAERLGNVKEAILSTWRFKKRKINEKSESLLFVFFHWDTFTVTCTDGIFSTNKLCLAIMPWWDPTEWLLRCIIDA